MAPKKFSPMRFTAATEESAVEGALQLVGATREEIDYDVLSDNGKGVTVRIRPRDDSAPAPAASSSDEVGAEDTGEAAQSEFEASDDEEDEAEAPLHIDSMREDGDFDDRDGADEATNDYEFIALDVQDAGEDLADDDADDELDFDASLELEGDEYDSDEDAEDEDADGEEAEPMEERAPERVIDPILRERALELTREFLNRLGLDVEAVPGEANGDESIPIVIEGGDVGILIGKHGATLQSFQYLINLTLGNARDLETEGVRVVVDAGNYRARRQSSLEAVARGAAQRVRREGAPVRLEPMPSNERRIVHNFLTGEPGIVTQSEGREPHRCVVVAPGRGASNGNSSERRNGARGMGGYTRGRSGRGRR